MPRQYLSTSVVLPEAAADPYANVLTDDHVQAWRRSGACVAEGVVPPDLLARVAADTAAVYPAAGTPEAASWKDFGSEGVFEFPSATSDAFNSLVLHPRLLTCAAQLLGVGVRDLRLTQGDAWPKYGQAPGCDVANTDQRIHCDYPNHTLLVPLWDAPDAVEMILYLDDEAVTAGATAVVPRSGPDDPAYSPEAALRTSGVAGLPYINRRAEAEAFLQTHHPDVAAWRAKHLYPRERLVPFRPGTLLLYRHDAWHRGTPVNPGVRRIVVNLTYRRHDAPWISVLHRGWTWSMYQPDAMMERLVATASVAQRCVLGFPAPGHRVWSPAMLAAVEARYAPYGFDSEPYRT